MARIARRDAHLGACRRYMHTHTHAHTHTHTIDSRLRVNPAESPLDPSRLSELPIRVVDLSRSHSCELGWVARMSVCPLARAPVSLPATADYLLLLLLLLILLLLLLRWPACLRARLLSARSRPRMCVRGRGRIRLSAPKRARVRAVPSGGAALVSVFKWLCHIYMYCLRR